MKKIFLCLIKMELNPIERLHREQVETFEEWFQRQLQEIPTPPIDNDVYEWEMRREMRYELHNIPKRFGSLCCSIEQVLTPDLLDPTLLQDIYDFTGGGLFTDDIEWVELEELLDGTTWRIIKKNIAKGQTEFGAITDCQDEKIKDILEKQLKTIEGLRFELFFTEFVNYGDGNWDPICLDMKIK